MKKMASGVVLLGMLWLPLGAAARNHHATFKRPCESLAKNWHGDESWHRIFTAEFQVSGEPLLVTYFVIATSMNPNEHVIPSGGRPTVGTTSFHIGVGLLMMKDNADGSCTVTNHGSSAKDYLKSRAKQAKVKFD